MAHSSTNSRYFVIATGVTSTVRDFLNICLNQLNITINVVGKGLSEKWYVDDYDSDQWPNISKGQCILKIHERFFRPLELTICLEIHQALEQWVGHQLIIFQIWLMICLRQYSSFESYR